MENKNYFKLLEDYINITNKLNKVLDSFNKEHVKYGKDNKNHNFIEKQITNLEYFLNENKDKKDKISEFMSLNQTLDENQVSIFYVFGKNKIISIVYDKNHLKTNKNYTSIGHKQLWETILFFNNIFDKFTLKEKLNLINEYTLTPRGRGIYYIKDKEIKFSIGPTLKKDKHSLLTKFDLKEINKINFSFDKHYQTSFDGNKEYLLNLFKNKKGFDYIKNTLKK